MSNYQHQAWPSWRYGPNGESAMFEEWDVIPAGWADHPSKATKETVDEEDAPEASEDGPEAADEAQEEGQEVAPRKRGRPRKNIEHQF